MQQLEIHNLNEFENTFLIPCIFLNNGKYATSIILESFDFVHGTNHQQKITLNKIPTTSQNHQYTISSFYNFIGVNDVQNIKQFLQDILSDSKLYQTTIHRFGISIMFSDSSNLELFRYFILPTMNKSSDAVTFQRTPINISINKNTASVKYGLLSTNIQNEIHTIISTTYSDVELFTNTYIQEKQVQHNVNIANYESTGLITFCIGSDIKQNKTLSNYSTKNQTTIITPTIHTIPHDTNITDDKLNKIYNFSVNISCNVFNGLTMVDYSKFFVKNGIEFNTIGNSNLINIKKYLN